jgi:tetratricopeptide (TPR) repeat protein
MDSLLDNPFWQRRVALFGKLGGMNVREAQQLVRKLGGNWLDAQASAIDLLICGADATTPPPPELCARCAEVIPEAELWQRLGLGDELAPAPRLYTPAMLANVLNISVSTIRRWYRCGWIVPARTVHRLPFFSFAEMNVCRQIIRLLAENLTEAKLQRRLLRVSKALPDVARPLADLHLLVDGETWLVRSGEHLQEPNGQRRFEFHDDPAPDDAALDTAVAHVPFPAAQEPLILAFPAHSRTFSPTVDMLLATAEDYEAAGELQLATEQYRAALVAGGPLPDVNARLADCLYRLGELAAARERYSVALELDDQALEVRVSLGCVLVDLQQHALAEATFQGALALCDDCPDAHFHLAKLLDQLERRTEATYHWQAFVSVAAESPWLEIAEQRLNTTGC